MKSCFSPTALSLTSTSSVETPHTHPQEEIAPILEKEINLLGAFVEFQIVWDILPTRRLPFKLKMMWLTVA